MRKQADAAPPAKPAPRFDWHRAMEGLRDEGLPMAGMVLGAYLGGKGVKGGEIAGSGIGYASGAIANLGLEHALSKRRSMATPIRPDTTAKAAGGAWTEFIPAAVGATVGAATGAGLSKDDKSMGRNMLAASAIGYGLGDLGLLAKKALAARR